MDGIFNELIPFLDAGRVHILEDRSLKIDDITVDDIGEYSCEADNAVGTIVASGMLLVHCEFVYALLNFKKLIQLFQQLHQPSSSDQNPNSAISDLK